MTQTFKYVGIETTTICNAKCTVCPREDHYGHRYGYMENDLFEKIILDLRDNHKVESLIRFGGMGDSSCDRFLLERLRFIKKEAPHFKVALSSNMERWKTEYSEAIINEELAAHMNFSILAYSEKFSEKVYKDKNLAAIGRVKIDEFFELNEKAGRPIYTEIYSLMLDGLDDDIKKIKDRYWGLASDFEIWQPHSWSNLYPDLRESQEERCPCKSVTRMDQIMIGIYGDIVPCSMDINYNLSIGSVKNQSIEEIMTGEKCQILQALNVDGKIETRSTCNGCVYLNAKPAEVLLESKKQSLKISR